ncbi:MAG: dienelactone hydrolase family protein [Acidobacteriaceae bacterium]|nr:dienelactone hydrolase family protein [Acidobacteriaceae bacterium]
MKEQDIQLQMPGGAADAVLFTPDTTHPLPGVLHFPDIGSIRDVQQTMAKRLASEGYVVLMPNTFYRTSRPPVFTFERRIGDPRSMERLRELIAPLTPEVQAQDFAVYIDFLASQPSVVADRIGIVGYCIGGSHALRTASIRPDKVRAIASFHGGSLYKENDPGSPHMVLPRVKAKLYFGHADHDPTMTADDIAHFEQALKAWGGSYQSELYAGAGHGWTVSDNPSYNEPSAERAYGKMRDLFKASL